MPSGSLGIGSPKTMMPPAMHEMLAAVPVMAMTVDGLAVLEAAGGGVERGGRSEPRDDGPGAERGR